MFPYPAQASIQVASRHERKFPFSLTTGINLTIYRPRCDYWSLPRRLQHR